MAAKRKRLTLLEKVQIIKEWKNGCKKSKVELAKQFQLPESTLKGILASHEKILEAVRKCGSSSNKRLKIHSSKTEEFDKTVLEWFNEAKAFDIPVSGTLLKEIALCLATKFGIENFQASCGWLSKFKERYGLNLKGDSGESASVDVETFEDWKEEVLPDIVKRYDKKNIFNAVETGLFYNLLPNETLAYKNEKCYGGERSKERLTVLLCANSDGSEKFTPLVIGRSPKPKCFKNVNEKPCHYTNNTKAWMTSQIFIDWVRKLDAKMCDEKRKILLLIEHCPAHPPDILGLRNVTIQFLLTDCTSKSQPLDLGIIHCVKTYYRRSLIRKLLICASEKKETKKLTVLEAMYMLCSAWNQISSQTIENCFYMAGILRGETKGIEIEKDDFTPDEWTKLVEDSGVTMEEYYNCDQDVLITELRCSDQIYDEIIKEDLVDSDEDTSDDETQNELVPPSFREANDAINILRRYIISSDLENSSFQLLEKLEENILKTRPKT